MIYYLIAALYLAVGGLVAGGFIRDNWEYAPAMRWELVFAAVIVGMIWPVLICARVVIWVSGGKQW